MTFFRCIRRVHFILKFAETDNGFPSMVVLGEKPIARKSPSNWHVAPQTARLGEDD
jgi:hypothetical protein